MSELQMPEPEIDFTPRTDHASGSVLAGSPTRSALGYNAVYRVGKFWFAYHKSPEGGTRRAGHGTREAAIDDIRQGCAGTWAFWSEKVEWRENGDLTPGGTRVIRVNGEHRTARKIRRDVDPSLLGSAGHWFKFRMLDSDEVVESNDVWWQGLIPVEFSELLPNNAEIVRNEPRPFEFETFVATSEGTS